MKRVIAAPLLLMCVCLSSSAQTPDKPKPEPQTKIEAFQAKTGSVLIKNYSEIGTVRGTGGDVTVTSWEFTDPQTKRKEQGISVSVKDHGGAEREERSYVDYDEIDSLLAGIDYISKVSPNSMKLKSYEAVYETRGKLKVTFLTPYEGLEVGVYAGNFTRTNAFFTREQFADVRKLIVDAKAALDAIR
jgi:hypothetical protein